MICENPSCTNPAPWRKGKQQRFCSKPCYVACRRPVIPPRHCRYCHKPLVHREGERWARFRLRILCDMECVRAERAARALGERPCVACGSLLVQRPDEDRRHFRGRRTCNRECAKIASLGGNLTWIDDKVDELVALIEQETAFAEIGKRLGVTKNAAIGKAHRMGIIHPKARFAKDKPTSTTLQRLAALDVFPPSRGCVYPLGEPGHADFHFCSADTGDITITYCPEHDKLCRPNALSEALRESWANDPERRIRAAESARQRGLSKIGIAARGKAA